MRILFGRDDKQLRRIESSLAALRSGSAADQRRASALIAALEREKAAVLSADAGLGRRRPILAHA